MAPLGAALVSALLVVLGVRAAGSSSCREPAGGAAGATVIPARRIASLLPSASALLVELGAGDRIVGRAADDDTPAVAGLPVVGTVLAPAPEALAAVEPDLVVVWSGIDPRAVGPAIGCHAELLHLRLDRLSDVALAADSLGARTGRGEAADRLVRRMQAVLGSLAADPPACKAPTVMWAVGLTPPVAAGPGSLPDDLLRAVGAANALADVHRPWPRPTLEALVAREVDLLVWPIGRELPPFARVPRTSPWRRIVGEGRAAVVEVDAALMHEAGPRVAEAARRLSHLLDDACGREEIPPTPPARLP